jgi:hypothetical protein
VWTQPSDGRVPGPTWCGLVILQRRAGNRPDAGETPMPRPPFVQIPDGSHGLDDIPLGVPKQTRNPNPRRPASRFEPNRPQTPRRILVAATALVGDFGCGCSQRYTERVCSMGEMAGLGSCCDPGAEASPKTSDVLWPRLR